jgi:hypothetical protein
LDQFKGATTTIQNYPAIGFLGFWGNASGNGFGLMRSNVTVKNCSSINGGYGAFPPCYPTNDGQNVASPGSGIYSTEVCAIWFFGGVNNGSVLTNGPMVRSRTITFTSIPVPPS